MMMKYNRQTASLRYLQKGLFYGGHLKVVLINICRYLFSGRVLELEHHCNEFKLSQGRNDCSLTLKINLSTCHTLQHTGQL